MAAQGRARRQVSVFESGSESRAQQQRGRDEKTRRTRLNSDTTGFESAHRPRRRRFWAVKRFQPRGSCGAGHRLTENTLQSTQTRPKLKETRRINTSNRTRLPRGPPRRPRGRFTFVTVPAGVGVEVISAPQPAHLRHLGQLAPTSDVTGAFPFSEVKLRERAHTHVSAATVPRTHAI